MSRLIDADALWKDITTNIEYCAEVLEIIERQPIVEPQRKRGKWIAVDSYSAYGGDEETWAAHGNPIAFHYCSECKGQAYAGETGEDILSDFCPNCGSYNGGEQDESNNQTD